MLVLLPCRIDTNSLFLFYHQPHHLHCTTSQRVTMQPIASFRASLAKGSFNAVFTPLSRSLPGLSYRPTQRARLPSAQWSRPSLRYNTSLAVPESNTAREAPRPQEPSYQLTFTCKPCGDRSAHVITKHGYHKGTILIKCPTCANRHVISDHLKIFMDEKSTLEDILKRTAGTDKDLSKLLKKGKLGMRQGEMIGREGDEDMEFWDDGSESRHAPAHPTP